MNKAHLLLTLAHIRGAALDDVHHAAMLLADEPTTLAEEFSGWLAKHNLLKKFPSGSSAEDARDRASQILSDCAELEIALLLYGDPDYPVALRALPDAPPVLFLRGSATALQHPRSIAVVGTRKPTEKGVEFARWVGRTLADHQVTVVSGLALGCDALAHQGTLEGDGVTVAVLAHGLDMVSPARHRELANAIVEGGGTLMSEYPPHTRAYPGNFVQRNRLQIGLAKSLIVIETSTDGGTMHTVSFAREQRKPIACLDHEAKWNGEEQIQGNRLILDKQWAVPLRNESDVMHFVRSTLHLPTAGQSTPICSD